MPRPRPGGPVEGHHRLPDREGSKASPSARRSTRWGCADRPPQSWCSTTASCRTRVMGPVNGGVGGADERARLRTRGAVGHAARDHAGLPRHGHPYVRERKQFGKPIGSFQLMQAKVADMYVALQFGARLCLCGGESVRRRADHALRRGGRDPAGERECLAGRGLEAIQALGGAGYTKDWPVERFRARRQAARHRRGHE